MIKPLYITRQFWGLMHLAFICFYTSALIGDLQVEPVRLSAVAAVMLFQGVVYGILGVCALVKAFADQ